MLPSSRVYSPLDSDDLDGAAELLPLDIHALIAPKILIAKFAGIFVVMQN